MDRTSKYFGRDVTIWGRNAIAGTAWEELYQYDQALDFREVFGAGTTVDVSSANVNDTEAGTGAQKIVLHGLDVNYNPLIEEITMNGRTVVTSAGTFLRLFGAAVSSAGTGLVNAGDIHIIKTGTGGTYTTGVPGTLTSALIKILATWTTGTTGMYTVPAGRNYEIRRIAASGYTQATILGVFIQPNGETDTFRGLDFVTGFGNQGYVDLCLEGAGLEYKEKTDILLRVWGAAASAVVQGSMILRQV